ncbi:MAG TPA: VCBS repeat-containing protein [Anaeromyxobacteraceae bacterium]|nr:VCBS repeat-containing protein [Anaeromyxobacteraceae bacterium]
MHLLLVATLSLAASAGAAPPPAVLSVAEALAARVGAPAEGRRTVALVLEAPAPALARAAETALAGALAGRGYAVSPLGGYPDPAGGARADGADWLLRVRAGLAPGRPEIDRRGEAAFPVRGPPGGEIALVGELVPTWSSFFLQRRPGIRPAAPRVVQARVPADPETMLLARPISERGLAVRPLARLPGRVLALAAGDPGDGRSAVLAVSGEEATLLSAAGEVLARRSLERSARAPVRDPAATAAVGDFGGGRLAWAVAGAPRAEVASLRGGRLEIVASLPAAPLCAGGAGALFGAFAPGTGVLRDVLSPHADPREPPRSERLLFAVTAAPAAGPVAFAALGTDHVLAVMAPDLSPVGPPIPGVGAGFALADLDGDGAPEVVASAAEADLPDRIRVLVPRASTSLVFESAPVEGAILAGAAADLTGDGIDDAILAAVREGSTELLLVTADPREAR